MLITEEFKMELEEIVDLYFNGDSDIKDAAIEYASIKASMIMGGRGHATKLLKDFHSNFGDASDMGIEVVVMHNNDYTH